MWAEMAVLEPKAALRSLTDGGRRFQRVRVDLLGRYVLPDRREFPCRVVDMSPGGMALIAPVVGQPGERVIALCRSFGPPGRRISRGFSKTASP